jgi:hypothetical protein
MKRGIAALTFLSILCFAVRSDASTNFAAKKKNTASSAVPAQGIPSGEKLVYDVYWMGLHVGFGELTVKEGESLDGKRVYLATAVARTNDALSTIYPVEDVVQSWIDASTFQSLRFGKKASEGRYRAEEIVRFDERAQKGYYESLKNGSKKEFPIHVPVHDVISAFYWVRRQQLEPGKSFGTVVNNGEKDYSLEVDVLRREEKELRGQGVVDSFLIEPKTRLEGILEKRGKVWVHLKNDAARTPVLITFKTPFGPIVGVLRKD